MITVCTGSVEYHHVEAVLGDTVIMPCMSTPSTDVMWIQNRTDGKFNRVYENGTIKGYHNIRVLFSVVNARTGDYSLRIDKVDPAYSGLYDCYDSNRRRIIGHYLIVEGKLFSILETLQFNPCKITRI